MAWNSVREKTKQCQLTGLSEFIMQHVLPSFDVALQKYVFMTSFPSYYNLTCFIIKP